MNARFNSDTFVSPINPRILVVDDHPVIRAALIALLRSRWEVCGEASNGVEAIDKVNELHPDLVLLDLSMPVMNGTRAAQYIHSIAPHTKIVFLSMYDSQATTDLMKMTGADGFVSKRGDAADLVETIGSFLDEPSNHVPH